MDIIEFYHKSRIGDLAIVQARLFRVHETWVPTSLQVRYWGENVTHPDLEINVDESPLVLNILADKLASTPKIKGLINYPINIIYPENNVLLLDCGLDDFRFQKLSKLYHKESRTLQEDTGPYLAIPRLS